MSYKYQLLRLRSPATCLNDLSEDHVVHGDWYDAWREILRARFPKFGWIETPDGMRGHAADGPRFEVSLRRDAHFTHVFVSASFHSDQRAVIQALASALGATVFDWQTGLALPPA